MNGFNAKALKVSFIVLRAIAFEFPATSAAAAAAAIVDTKETDSPSDDFSAITTRTNVILQLEVVINGQHTGKIGQFDIRAGRPFARLQDLRGFGLSVQSISGDDQSL